MSLDMRTHDPTVNVAVGHMIEFCCQKTRECTLACNGLALRVRETAEYEGIPAQVSITAIDNGNEIKGWTAQRAIIERITHGTVRITLAYAHGESCIVLLDNDRWGISGVYRRPCRRTKHST